MANSLAHRHFLRVLSLWPKDALRPESSFQDAMRRRLQRRLEPAEQEPERAKEAAAAEIKGAGVTAMERNQKEELEQVNALYSLLEDRYKRKHPVSEAFFRPASHPSHYSDLLAELEAVPKRSWLASKINKWRGFLRLQ